MKKNTKSLEFEGNTIDEAIKNATTFLNVSREAITIKILCEEKKGLFGMAGAKQAKIKVFLKKINKNG